MDQITHDVRRENWLNIVTQCQNRQSDISVKQWLTDNGIKEKAYYYWLRKFRKEAYGQMQLPAVASKSEVTFAEVSIPPSSPKLEMIAIPGSEYIPVAVIKGLLWQGTGFLLLYKRLEDGRFSWPRTTQKAEDLTEEQFNYLMLGLNPLDPKVKEVTPSKSY